VPGSYKYRADADVVSVEVDLRPDEERENPLAGRITISGFRGTAPTRPGGRGDLLTAHLRKKGQSQGRLVK
jgi:hypothetical protein